MVVMEFTSRSGVRVQVCDDAYAGISEEEEARRRRQISEAINRINDSLRRRAAEAQQDQ